MLKMCHKHFYRDSMFVTFRSGRLQMPLTDSFSYQESDFFWSQSKSLSHILESFWFQHMF